MTFEVRRLLALGVLVVTVGAAAQTNEESFAASDAELARLGVEVGSVELAERVELAAAPAAVVVPPSRQALVSAPQGGVVARLLVAEGDVVAVAQPLAEIDSAEYLERQRDYLDAVAAAELAGTQEARDRGLFDEGIIAERRVAETSAMARAARSRLDQAGAQLALAGFTRADLERLATERRLATRIVLRAPLAGTVVAVHGSVGGRVGALDPVLAVADLRELWLETRLPQERAAGVAVGMSVAVAPPGHAELVGTVTAIGGVVDPATQTVLVRAAIDNSSGALRAGQFLTARIRAPAPSGGVLVVPVAALTRHEGDILLFVRSGGDVLARRVAVLGEDGARAYVRGDLKQSELIAVAGIGALKALWLSAREEGG
jgi:cobalt-zinc-cadmium efflux system membrane fusion protein